RDRDGGPTVSNTDDQSSPGSDVAGDPTSDHHDAADDRASASRRDHSAIGGFGS
ncbi:MAG: hypothetical protein RL119_908, partial [Actinomycetota bacterium]